MDNSAEVDLHVEMAKGGPHCRVEWRLKEPFKTPATHGRCAGSIHDRCGSAILYDASNVDISATSPKLIDMDFEVGIE